MVVQLRLGASNYSFQECRAAISATEAEEQVYASRDKFNPAHAKISAPQCLNVPRYFISPLSCLFFGSNDLHGRSSRA